MSIALWKKCELLEERVKALELQILNSIPRSPELDRLLANLDKFERALGKHLGRGDRSV